MKKQIERQCQVCGLIFDLENWVPVNKFVCNHCRGKEMDEDNKATKALKRMKKKIGA